MSFDYFPDDVALEIFSHFSDPKVLCSLARVSKQFRGWSEDDLLWSKLFAKEYPWATVKETSTAKSEFRSYFGLFQRGICDGKLEQKTLTTLSEKAFNLNVVSHSAFVVPVANDIQGYTMDKGAANLDYTIHTGHTSYDSHSLATPAGDVLTCAVNNQGGIRLFSKKAGKEVALARDETSSSLMFAAHLDERRMFGGGFDHKLTCYDYVHGKQEFELDFGQNVMSLQEYEQGDMMAVAQVGKIDLVDLRLHSIVGTLNNGGEDLQSSGYMWRVCVSENHIVSTLWDQTAVVFDRRQTSRPLVVINDSDVLQCRALFVSGGVVVVGSGKGDLYGANITTGEEMWRIREAQQSNSIVTSIAMMGTTLLTVGWDAVIRGWHPQKE